MSFIGSGTRSDHHISVTMQSARVTGSTNKAVVKSSRVAGANKAGSLQVLQAVKSVFMPALSSTMTEGKVCLEGS